MSVVSNGGKKRAYTAHELKALQHRSKRRTALASDLLTLWLMVISVAMVALVLGARFA